MAPTTSTIEAIEPLRRQKKSFAQNNHEDDLADSDIPWEWIYNTTPTVDETDEPQNDRKRRKVTGDKIVGARVGLFECHIGDVVMLKADGSNEAWIALICEFVEDDGEGEMAANFMWFSSEKDIRNRDKKRSDYHWVRLAANDSIQAVQLTTGAERALHLPIMGHQPPSLNQRQGQGHVPRQVPRKIPTRPHTT